MISLGPRPLPTRRLMLIGSASFALAGCASLEPKKTPIKFFVQADQSINPDARGNPFPVVVRIYELKQSSQFNQLAFFDLLDSDAAKRFRDFLNEHARRQLPVFFNIMLDFRPHLEFE